MTIDDAKAAINKFQSACAAVADIVATAEKGKQSITGTGMYGNRFRQALVNLNAAEHAFNKVLAQVTLSEEQEKTLSTAVERMKSARSGSRALVLHDIQMICQANIIPRLSELEASSTPVTEQVLPSAVVAGTRGFLVKVVAQMNGCYEHQWYDACSVMIRKFVEMLIIEVYEEAGRPEAVKGPNQEYMMLRDLVGVITSDKAFQLGREVKQALPALKIIGDRAAHTRRYLSTKSDVEALIPGLRVVADELLYLADFK